MLTTLNAANILYLSQLNAIRDRMTVAENQITSGKKINQASDAPDQISELLAARASLSSTQQINQNLGRIKTEVDSAEVALEQASTAIQQAQVLGTQGGNSTQTPETRSAIADQVGSIINQVVGISRTAVEGRYIFSGDSDQTPPYTVDLTQSNPISGYQGSPVTRQVQHPNGTTFTVASTAQQIFDAPAVSDNVFSSLVALRAALQNGDQTGISSALNTLGTAKTYFERQLAFYGNTQSNVTNATSYGQSAELDLTTQIGNIQDADLSQAILELTQSQTSQKAALQAKASLPTTSLFDFLR